MIKHQILLHIFIIMYSEVSTVSDQILSRQAEEALKKIKELNDHPDWQYFSDQPCKMYRMYIDDRLVSKGQAVVKLPMDKLFVTLNDEELVKNLNAQLKQVLVLREFRSKGKKAKVHYMSFHGAWPIAGRDFVNVTATQENQKIAYIASIGSKYSHPEVQNVVRAVCHIVGHILRKIDQHTTQITYISDVDLAGSIPLALKNKLIQRQAQMPKTIEDVFTQNSDEKNQEVRTQSLANKARETFKKLDQAEKMIKEMSAVSDQILSRQAEEALKKIKELNDHPDWQYFSDQPCKMYRMYIDDRLVSKGQAVVKLPMDKLFVTLNDEELVKNLNAQLKQVTVLREFTNKGRKGKVHYMSFHGAWPIAGRDFVNVTATEENSKIAYIASIRSKYSHPEVQQVVRAVCHIVGHILRKIDEHTTQITYISDVDLAGSIPVALKNKLIQRQACMPKTIQDVFQQEPNSNNSTQIQ